ncbi:class I SAM-dependent methyltransferase [Rhodocaloribacter sp.]
MIPAGRAEAGRRPSRVDAGLLALLSLAVAAMSVCAGVKAWWYGFVAAALAAGALVVLLWRRGAFPTRTVLVAAVCFRLAVLWLPPSLSDDAYRYVWDGMLQVEGVNPYLHTPEDPALARFHDAPIFDELNSPGFFSVYPPLSQLFFAVAGLFYGFGWKVAFYVLKVLLAGMEVGALLLLARMVDARRLMLYAWNPLVVMEAAGQAHTEAIMVFFLVLTVWLARRGRGGWAAAALAGAGWVKLYPFVLFPFLWRRYGWRAVWPPLVVTALLLAPYADPSIPGHLLASLDLYVRYFEFNAGPYYAVKKLFLLATGDDWSKTLGPAFRVVFLAALPALYFADWRRQWPLYRAFVWTMGAFFLCATTVHPWYVLGLLALTTLAPRPSWHWLWFGLFAMGTYLRYVDGPYWLFVNLSWGGWAVLAAARYADAPLQRLQRLRAKRKLAAVRDFFPPDGPLAVLDLGAGEGYVGEAAARDLGARVHLADVVDMNRTALPHTVYDGRRLPFPDDAFDVTVLYFVLHHSEDPSAVLREALRVSRRGVIVAESVYEKDWDRRLLTFLDTLANRLRSGGLMRGQEEHLHFRTAAGWRALFAAHGATVVAERRRGRWVHRQALFRVKRAS